MEKYNKLDGDNSFKIYTDDTLKLYNEWLKQKHKNDKLWAIGKK